MTERLAGRTFAQELRDAQIGGWVCLAALPSVLPTREERQTSDDKMKTNGTRILPDIKSRFIFDPDPFLDDDFDGLGDILAEDLIAELGNNGRGIAGHFGRR